MRNLFPLLILVVMLQSNVFAGSSSGRYAKNGFTQLQDGSRSGLDVSRNSAGELDGHADRAVMSNSSTYLNNYYNWAHAQYGLDPLGSRLPNEH